MPPLAQMRTPWFCLMVGLWLQQEGPLGAAALGWGRRASSVASGPCPGRDFQECVLLCMPLPPCPGEEVYSTIRKQEYNGKIPRFRRIQGEIELYTSDTVMQSEPGSSWAVVGRGL